MNHNISIEALCIAKYLTIRCFPDYYSDMLEDRPSVRTREEHPSSPREGALRNLSYIRDTMERSASFTAVSGWGGVGIGVVGFAAAGIASIQPNSRLWLITWICAAFLALAITVVATARKARSMGIPLSSGAGRKFTIGMAPSLFAGTILTAVFYQHEIAGQLPGVWLLLYGAGIVTAGITSVSAIRVMGICFMALGTVAFLSPTEWGDVLMALGFGGFNFLFGIMIIKKYGG